MRAILLLAILCALAFAAAAGPSSTKSAGFILSSTAFEQGKLIPGRFTCDGLDMSPPLQWSGLPEGTKALALICDDPDAPVGTWDHWLIYDLPPSLAGLPEGVGQSSPVPSGAVQGKNSWSKLDYGGPCPPPGKPHRYFFRLYALKAPLGLEAGAAKAELLAAIKGQLLATAELVGTYGRP